MDNNNIVKLICPKCGKEFVIDESNIAENTIYNVKYTHCGESMERRKPISGFAIKRAPEEIEKMKYGILL